MRPLTTKQNTFHQSLKDQSCSSDLTVNSTFTLPEALQQQSRKMPCETWNPKTSKPNLIIFRSTHAHYKLWERQTRQTYIHTYRHRQTDRQTDRYTVYLLVRGQSEVLTVGKSVHMPVCLFVCLSVCLSDRQSVSYFGTSVSHSEPNRQYMSQVFRLVSV